MLRVLETLTAVEDVQVMMTAIPVVLPNALSLVFSVLATTVLVSLRTLEIQVRLNVFAPENGFCKFDSMWDNMLVDYGCYSQHDGSLSGTRF